MTDALTRSLESLNENQRLAVTSPAARLLVLSGAGSGKTRVITTRIAWAVEQFRIPPESILAVTFTNKAAREMKERVEELVPQANRVMIRTFHSFGAWFLRRNGSVLDLSSNFAIFDDQDSADLIKTLTGKLPRHELRALVNGIARAKDFYLTPEDDLTEINANPDFAEIYGRYEKRLREIGNVDFGDLINLPVRILEEQEAIRKRIRQRYQMILVDEYQDSNYTQFRLLEQLTGDDALLCVVGDDDQSIYKFRGACVENILDFPTVFTGTEVIRLEQNYRSTNNILDAASAVIENNKERMGKTLWSENPAGEEPEVVICGDQEEEASFCVDLLQDRRYGETAILYRTNAQSRTFEKWFRRYNIPYVLVGALSFYSREEVKDALAYLQLIINSRDEIAFRRIANKPARGLGRVSLDKLIAVGYESRGDFSMALGKASSVLKGKAAAGAARLSKVLSEYRFDKQWEDLGQYLKELLEATGLVDYYKAVDDAEGTMRLKNLEELVNAAAEFPGSEEGLAELLELIALDQSALEAEEESDPNRVTLITMHNTKGLEFDRVVITGLEEGLFPRDTDDDLEEERRLFYVAITRARKELYFTTCRDRMQYGQSRYLPPSRFLSELPRDKVRVRGGRWDDLDSSEPSSEFKRGVRIYHDDYGNGVVTKVLNNGGHTVIHVGFESGRRAVFIPEFARNSIEILGSGEFDF